MQSESAVESITLSPRSSRLEVGELGQEHRVRVLVRIAVVDPVDAVLPHQDGLGADLEST